MRATRRWRIAVMFLGLSFVASPWQFDCAQGQDAGNPAEAQKTAAAPAQPEAKAPDDDLKIFYVRDAHGQLVPLLGFTYDDILEFLKTQREQATPPRRFSVEQLTCTGQVRGNRAELDAVFTIRLEDDRWIEAKLFGKGAVLTEAVKYEGSGTHSLEFDKAVDAYVLRLRGTAKSGHKLSARLFVPLTVVGDEQRLALELIDAAASQLSLRLPEPRVNLASHRGAAAAEVKPLEGGSQIDLWGLSGPLSITWRRPGDSSPVNSALEATGQIVARIDARSIQYEASLSVRSPGTEFDRFHVRLPDAAQLVAAGAPMEGYTASPSKDGPPHLIDVRLNQPTTGPVQIRLQAERPYGATQADEEFDLAGFSIPEALAHRQWGYLAVAVSGDRHLTWGKPVRLQQVDELPENIRFKEVVAGFEYFGQPASLPARLAPRRTRVTVEPEYVYFVEPQRIRLEARFKYTVRGAKLFALEIAMPGWEIDELGPASVVDAERGFSSDGPTISAPLVGAVPGQFEMTLSAHRDLPADAQVVEWNLPVPTADVLAPSTVAIVPADNVRLRPDEDRIAGLERQSIAPDISLPHRQQTPSFFRGEQSQAVFAAFVEHLDQAVAVNVESAAHLGREEVLVEQQFEYRVDHEPLQSLVLDVPRAAMLENTLELTIDGQPLVPVEPAADTGQDETLRLDAPLDHARIGTFKVAARYRIPQTPLSTVSATPFSLPLIMPADVAIGRNELALVNDPGIRLTVDDEAWSAIEERTVDTTAAGQQASRFRAQGATPLATIDVRLDPRGPKTTIVERAWLQTWLTGAARQDRAAYRLRTSEEDLTISIPVGVSSGNIEGWLDGQPIPGIQTSVGSVTIQLPPVSAEKEHLLELRYQFADRTSDRRTIDVELPLITGPVWYQRIYWQFVFPTDWHLLTVPPELTSEFTWYWTGLLWGRRAPWDQLELEKWSGATSQPPLPEGTNRYLFSATGNPGRFTVGAVPRWQIVLGASLLALGACLALIYLPATRHPASLVVGAVVLSAVAAWQPDAAIVLAQAASLGIALGVVALILQRLIGRRRAGGVVVRSGSSSVMERGSTHARVRALEAAPRSSVELPPALEHSAVESHHG